MRPTQLIYLTKRDTPDTACALLQRTKPGTQVWLVIPWGASLFRNTLNLKRLQRAATQAAVDLRVVARHRETRTLAREVGLAVYWRLPQELRKRDVPQMHTHELGPRVIPIEEELKARRFIRRPKPFGFGSALLSLLLAALLMAALVGVVIFFVPTAQISLEPVASLYQTSFSVQANPRYRSTDLEGGVIPARMVQVTVEAQGETPATGQRDVPDQHASGMIVLANRTDRPLTVPKGTIVRTSSGVTQRFYTTVDVELPPGPQNHVRVPVIALEPGFVVAEPFTVNRVEGELAAQVEALNDVRIEGGSNRRVSIVAYNDFDTLRTLLIERLQREAYDRILEELQPGEFVPTASIEVQVMSLDFDQVVDQQSDVLSGRMKLVASGVAIQENDIRDVARWLLTQQAGGESQVIEESLEIVRSDQIRVLETGLELDVQAQGMVAPMINLEQVQSAIRGRQVEEASAWLRENLALRSAPQIEVTPDLTHRLPMLAGRMEITISAGNP